MKYFFSRFIIRYTYFFNIHIIRNLSDGDHKKKNSENEQKEMFQEMIKEMRKIKGKQRIKINYERQRY